MPVSITRRMARQQGKWGNSYSEFRQQPFVGAAAGGIAVKTDTAVNVWQFPEIALECINIGTAAIDATNYLVPVIGASGLDVARTPTADTGWELTQGITARSPSAFTVGTHAFYAKCQFALSDISGTDDCAFGFRKAEAYQAAIDNYADMAALNVIAGAINIETIAGGAATTTTDTTDTWADGATHTLEIYVAKTRAVTYKIDGAAPTTTAAFSLTNALVVVPFLYFLHDTDICDNVYLLSWECGLTAM